MADELERIADDAAQGFMAAGEMGARLAMADHRERVENVLLSHYRRTFQAFGERLLDATRGTRAPERKDTQSDFARRTQEFISTVGADKVTRIADTTQRQIVDAILRGQEEGEGQAAIARRIREHTGGVIGGVRADVIARTETHSAAQTAHDEALDVLDLPEVRREWVAAEDERTRTTHSSADGQVRGQQEAFDVGFAKLRFPGDPLGPPSEVINCRCIAASVIE